ncbi:MAG: phage tail length tape measure family protein [Sphingomonas sp.]
MSQALIGNLAAILTMNTSAFERGATHAQRLMRQTQRQFQQLGQRISGIGAGLSVSITAPFAALMHSAIPAAIESRAAIGQVNAALASMGPAAGRTTEQLQAMAAQLQRTSTLDDDDILRSVTANLLTFGNVSGQVFDRAQQAIVNVSTRMGTDLQSATIAVGRALNDPVAGMASLRRQGIQFTAEQQSTIRAMVATGNVAGAQAVMLGELERQFGGAAQAARDASPTAELNERWRTFQEVVGDIALRVLPPLTGALTRLLEGFTSLSPRMQEIAIGGAAIAAALGPVLLVVGPLVGAMGSLLPLIVGLSGPMLLAIAAGAAAVAVAFANWDSIGPVVNEIGRSLIAAIGPPVLAAVTTLRQAMTDLWRGPFGQMLREVGPPLAQVAQWLGSAFGSAMIGQIRLFATLFAAAIRTIVDAANLVLALLRGDWSAAWTNGIALVTNLFRSIGNVILSVAPNIVNQLRGIYEGVRTWLVNGIGNLVNAVLAPIRQIEGGFRWLYQRVVGNSWIPDMVTEIGQHMARLDALMVRPAENAAAATEAAFRETQQRVSALLDRLFPEVARARELAQSLIDIDAAGLSPAARSEARRRAFLTIGGALETVTPIGGSVAEESNEAVRGIERVRDAVGELGRDINQVMVRGLQGLMRGFGSLQDIALNVLYSIGDAIIENLFTRVNGSNGQGGLGGAIASALGGLIGGGLSGRRAYGGPVAPGGTYLIGERGPELLTMGGARGYVTPNDALRDGPRRMVLEIQPSPLFRPMVREEATGVVVTYAPMLQGGAVARMRDDGRRAS